MGGKLKKLVLSDGSKIRVGSIISVPQVGVPLNYSVSAILKDMFGNIFIEGVAEYGACVRFSYSSIYTVVRRVKY